MSEATPVCIALPRTPEVSCPSSSSSSSSSSSPSPSSPFLRPPRFAFSSFRAICKLLRSRSRLFSAICAAMRRSSSSSSSSSTRCKTRLNSCAVVSRSDSSRCHSTEEGAMPRGLESPPPREEVLPPVAAPAAAAACAAAACSACSACATAAASSASASAAAAAAADASASASARVRPGGAGAAKGVVERGLAGHGASCLAPPPITLPTTPAGDRLGGFAVPGAVATAPSPGAATIPSPMASSLASPGSATPTTRSGFHLRGRIRLLVKSLSGVSEETPTPTPGSSSTPSECHIGGPSPLASHLGGPSPWGSSSFGGGGGLGDVVSLTELRHLVAALDSQKDGFVDYTLLLASLIPPDVYSDEQRIAEVFEIFDLQKRGSVGPRDFCMALLGDGSKERSRRCDSLRQITEMLTEFDVDGDGRLSFAEFRAMARGWLH
mmetsp:Transcript_81362/g.264061  ORF Transcript_81362/g.264061 Transcript_81362/m.264061 type:complete len:437 (-) Transcript_81362:295-1605(-)